MADAAWLTISRLSKQFGQGEGAVSAIREISFSVPKGTFLSILGPSGCGKSTLFNLIAGLMQPTSGDVLMDGRSVINRPGQVGYMLQKDLLLPWRTIEDNITLGLTLQGIFRKEARKMALPLMEKCGLDGFAHHKPQALSGGMRQRAALLRTLLTGQETLLLDEPFGALDAITRLQLQMLLTQIWQEMGKTILFVTHDVDEALLLSDEILLLSRRPGTVLRRFMVDLPRPRTPHMLAQKETAALKADMMDLLWKEVGQDGTV